MRKYDKGILIALDVIFEEINKAHVEIVDKK
jgi:hypothetical protein